MDKETRQHFNKVAEKINQLCDVIDDLHGQIEWIKKELKRR